MLGRKKHEEIDAFLGKGAEFFGKFIFNGFARIDGNFAGEIFSEGTLAIGEGARIKADINVGNVLISGTVEGRIDARERVRIYPTGRFLGSIKTPVLAIEEGAFFEGTSCMTDDRDKESLSRQS